MAITPGSCVAIAPSTRKNWCGNDCYETKRSKIFSFFLIFLQEGVVITPRPGVAITPRSGVSITPST